MENSFTPGQDRVFYTKAVYGQEEIDAVIECLKAGWLGPGRYTEQFEQQIAELFGKKYGLFVNSGSSANLLAMEIVNLSKGSEVITQACTFPATLNPILLKGLRPVFVDSKVGTYNIDVDKIEGAISENTKAIFISHAIGSINDMARISEICKKHNLIFIEDSCDTHGSKFDGKPAGFWSDITTTSFYASHNITAAGGGGMVMTNNDRWIKDAKVYRDWGRALPENYDEDIAERFKFKIDGQDYDGKFTYLKVGYNFKPVEVQAAFGLAQLKKLSVFNAMRVRNFKRSYDFFARYSEHFILPEAHPKAEGFWLAFPLTIKDGSPIVRKNLLTHLEENKIQTRLLFSGNILHHEPYKNMDCRIYGDLTQADKIMRDSFLIGCHHGMTDEMLDYVFHVFEAYLKSV